MQLVDYQNSYLNRLHEELVDNERKVILFTGPKGCGKSVIINELVTGLGRKWQVFSISGTGEASPPYYTWYADSHKSIKQSKMGITNISFGVTFEPMGLPFGLEIGLDLSSEHFIYNSNEQAILKELRRKANRKEKILFIAEDYYSWDTASKELLTKIIFTKSTIFTKNKSIHTILVDSSPSKTSIPTPLGNIALKIQIDDITCRDVQQIIRQQPYMRSLEMYNLENITRFTGYDLRLINLAIHYQQGNPEITGVQSLTELLERRIACMSQEQKSICKTLECVSIINSLFSEKEAAYLLNQDLINTERALQEAVNLNLIRKRHAYDFPDSEIQKYFEDRLDFEKKYLHRRLAKYLQMNFPEDYFSRAYHLHLSEQAYSEQNALEAAYLMTIEIVRRKELTGNISEPILEDLLHVLLELLPPLVDDIVKTNINDFKEGNDLLRQCNYLKAVTYFSNMNLVYATETFAIEVLRLLLLSHVQLADDLDEIKRLADRLYEQISDTELHEDEIWCQSALLLLEVYGDRHIHRKKFQWLKNGFEMRVRAHMYQSAFRTLHARYACKAALFYNSLLSVKLTEESCGYYRNYNSVLNLYYSLCNNAANRILSGDYTGAETRLKECKNIVAENSNIQFPSTYKIENNLIINTFLQSEGCPFDLSSRKRGAIIPAAAESVEQLTQLRGKQGHEVSHIIEFNLLSMYMMTEDKNKVSNMLLQFEKKYKYLDTFYKYYYHSACCSDNIITGNFINASNHLDTLENLDVLMFSGFTKILTRRNQILHQLIDDKFSGDAFDYNYEFLKRGIRVQDPSASFWGRGFLLSDLQFLSF